VSTQYDVVIVGAGLNGLVTAAYLARAGKKVLVAERRDTVGGAVSTEEFALGFRAPAAFAAAELFHPAIIRELKLDAHGLALLPAGGGTFLPGHDVERLSPADAAALAAFDAFLRRLAEVLDPVLTRPLPDVKPSGPGDVLELLTLGWRLRGLGKRDLPEALRYLPMPVKDVLDERFESEALKAAIAGPALTGSWLAPRSAGSALMLLLHRPSWTAGLLSPPVFARGGPGALADAVAAAARGAGAEIRTGSKVERILIDDDGRAAGVALTGGTEIAARLVVSNADPRRTLLELVDPAWLDPEHAAAARNIRTRGTVAIVQLALGGLPAFTDARDGSLSGRIQLGASLDELERAFDGVKYGKLPEKPFLTVTIPSLTDPSLAPEGKHVLHVWAQYAPYRLAPSGGIGGESTAEGTWDERRDELGDLVVRRIEEHAPGFSGLVEHRRVRTPIDLERDFGCTGGCLYHAEPALDQMLFMRPMAGWYQYRTPVDGLYLCGPGTHPGVGMTGLPGKSAAAQILEDWR